MVRLRHGVNTPYSPAFHADSFDAVETLARASLRIVHVVEDDSFAQLSESRLAFAGFRQPIVRCRDGVRALQYFSAIARQETPHVILLDLDMGGMHGVRVLHWLRHNYGDRDVAIYLLTPLTDGKDSNLIPDAGDASERFDASLFNKLIQNLDHLIEVNNCLYLENHSKSAPDHAGQTPVQPQGTSMVRTQRLTISFSTA
jgi:CheY-like chemotaxis protein